MSTNSLSRGARFLLSISANACLIAISPLIGPLWLPLLLSAPLLTILIIGSYLLSKRGVPRPTEQPITDSPIMQVEITPRHSLSEHNIVPLHCDKVQDVRVNAHV